MQPSYETNRSPVASGAILLYLIACLSLSAATVYHGGFYSPLSLVLLTVSLITCAIAVLAPSIVHFELPLNLVMPVALVIQIALGLLWPPLGYVHIESKQKLIVYYMGLIAATLLARWLFVRRSPLGAFTFPMLVIVYLIVGIWTLRSSDNPWLDVYVFQRDATGELLQGNNPYAMTFPNLYGPDPRVYGPDVVVNDRVQYGYPYPPLSLLVAAPGRFLGDFRFSHMLAIAGAALLIGFTRRTPASFAAAGLLLFMPRSFYVLECSATEAFAVFFLALTTWCALHKRSMLPYVFGLLIVTKQYLPVVIFPALLLYGRPIRWREFLIDLAKALIVGAVVSLPLALWDWHAFWRSAVQWQFIQPFREDALSYLPLIFGSKGPRASAAIAFVVVAIAIAATLWKAPRTVAGFVGSITLVTFCFFAFNKQAFTNYYFFVIAGMCCCMAVADAAEPAMVSRSEQLETEKS